MAATVGFDLWTDCFGWTFTFDNYCWSHAIDLFQKDLNRYTTSLSFSLSHFFILHEMASLEFKAIVNSMWCAESFTKNESHNLVSHKDARYHKMPTSKQFQRHSDTQTKCHSTFSKSKPEKSRFFRWYKHVHYLTW